MATISKIKVGSATYDIKLQDDIFSEQLSSYYDWSEGLVYTSNGDGTCYVSGIGDCTDTNIIIPRKSPDGDLVTSIGTEAFLNCVSLTSFTIPDSVKSIGEGAFSGCTGLTGIEIPDSVESLGSEAFAYCTGFTNVTIGNGVTSIGDYAFRDCNDLTVYAEADEKPDNWSENWNNGLKQVIWKAALNFPAVNDELIVRKNDISSLSNTIGNLINIMNYRGEFTDTTSVTNPEAGDVITINQGSHMSMRIYNGELWIEIGTADVSAIEDDIATLQNQIATLQNQVDILQNQISTVGLLFTRNTDADGNNDGTCYVSGLADTCTEINVIIPRKSPDGDLVTGIGNSAFKDYTLLKRVIIPDDVESIGDYAFSGCTGLTSIEIPDSVESIGSYAFASCTSLTSITIPNSVMSIGNKAFYNCTGLTSITISDSMESIGSGAFEGCSNLTSVYITDIASWCNISFDGSFANPVYYAKKLYIKKLGTNEYELLTNLVIPDSVTEIKDYAFYNCRSLTSVTIPDSVTSIGEKAFWYCSSLTSITIPNSVTSIGDSAFHWCYNLTSVTIPDGVTSIGKEAFRYCDSLKSVYITDIASWCNISFSDDSANPVYYAGKLYVKKSGTDEYELLTNLVIPDSVTKIEDYAFCNCDSLRSVTIGNSVTSIGEDAFYGCDSLTSVTIGNSITWIGFFAFFSCDSLKSVYYDGDIASWCNISFGRYANLGGSEANPLSNGAELYFKNTSGEYELLTNLVIPDSVTKIKDSAFNGCSSLTSVTIPDSVTSISRKAFAYCNSLTSVTIPDSVTSIGSAAFSSTAYYNDSSNWENGVLYIGKYLIDAKYNILSGAYTVKEGTKLIADYAFSDCDNLTSVTIPNSVTSIGDYAFRYCDSLKSVYITDIAKWCAISFGDYSANPLYYANNLYLNGTLVTDLEIPNSVTSIGEKAFYKCSSLTSVTIPDSVTSIGSYAFMYCGSLTSVTIGSGITSIGSYAFRYCDSLENIYINTKKGLVSGSPWGANNAKIHWNSTGPDAA